MNKGLIGIIIVVILAILFIWHSGAVKTSQDELIRRLERAELEGWKKAEMYYIKKCNLNL